MLLLCLVQNETVKKDNEEGVNGESGQHEVVKSLHAKTPLWPFFTPRGEGKKLSIFKKMDLLVI